MKVKKILFPTDFSIFSERALQDAFEIANQYQAELILLHVVEIQSSYDLYGTVFVPSFFTDKFDEIKDETIKRFRKIIESKKDLSIRYIIKEGNPFEEILHTEDEEDVDLVIIGSHGHTVSLFALLGSVSEKVVRKSLKPVLVLKYPELKKERD